MIADEIECIEEGTEPTIALVRHLAAALDADVHLTAGHDSGSVWFERTQLDLTSTAVRGQGAYATHYEEPSGRGVQYPPNA